MQAVIMAGGKGTRLSSVLQNIPKPMVNFAGKPLLEHQVENLRDNGITDIVLVIGYLGEVIQNYFGDGKRFGVNIEYYFEKTPLGTAGALYCLYDKLKEDFILLFGDLYININFQRFYMFHKLKKARISLYVHPNSHPYDSDIVIPDENGKVVGWSFKNSVCSIDYKNIVNAGVYVISSAILKGIPPNQNTDLEKDLIVPIISSGGVYAYQCTEYIKDIGTPERLKKAEADYNNGVCEQRNLKYRQKCIFLDRDGTINRHVGFLNSAEQMVLEDYVVKAIRRINQSEYLVIVISNQPVIARGDCTLEELKNIHNRMYTLLGQAGAYVDDLYFCPHHPDMGFLGEIAKLKIKCNCRKPDVGMIEQAVQEHNIDLENSWIVGDTTLDIQTGINAGIKTALVLTGEAGADGKYNVIPDIVQDNLLDCVNYILSSGGKRNERTD